MISAWHLIWIIPTAAMFGLVLCALVSVNNRNRER